jgi:protease-4
MSEASKEQVSSYLNGISNYFYSQIAEARGMSMEKTNEILNMPKIHTPEDAVKFGLITQTGYFDQFEDLLREKLELKEGKSITYVELKKYLKAKKYIKEGDRNNRVAVIIGQGDIVSGKSDGSNIASDSWIEELRKAVKDDKVKAIVLRINSGGGSAMASDIMWREIELAKKKKPVIASMGDYAASGGYYMAMGCDTIVANPTTITGSIGIFGMLFNAQELMNSKLGINFDGVKTHEYANFPSLTRDMSSVEKGMIQSNVESGYEKFTSKAASGRKMDLPQLKSIAGGRVWTGEQGKENGLVDVLGTLEDAIKIAAQKGNIDDYRVVYYPKPKNQFELIMDRIENSSQVRFEEYFGDLAPEMRKVKQLMEMDKLQARMPFELHIQ